MFRPVAAVPVLLLVVLVAGCSGVGGPAASQPTVTSTAFTYGEDVHSDDPDSPDARVTYRAETTTVVITGLRESWPARSCVAFDRSATYHAGNGTLRVVVDAERASTAGTCNATAAPWEYEYTVTMAGGLPDHVVVVHPAESAAPEYDPIVATASRTGD